MLSARFTQMISDHWREIADRVIKRMREEKQLAGFDKYPDADLRERTQIILHDIGKWLVYDQTELARRYEQLSKIRFEEGVPLHVLVYAFQTIKRSMIQYIREESFVSRAIEIYAREELEYSADRIFDTMIYHIVRGYEQAMTEAPEKFGSSNRLPAELRLPLPI